MRRIAGAAALAYVVLAAIENMELLGLPGLGAPAAEVRAAYADRALSIVTLTAGALSLIAYVVFAAALRPRRLWAAAGAAGLAGAGVAAAATFDPSAFDLQLMLRYLAGPLMGVFLLGFSRVATVVALPLLATPLALAGFEFPAQLAFAAHAAWIWGVGMTLTVDSVRNAAFLMLVLAAGAVGAALLIVPDATGTFFAWGLKPASLAAFAGGVYVASAVVYAVGLRARDAHGLVVAAAVLSVSMLAATLAHLEVFDFGRLQAWAWLALFAAFGITTSVLAVRGPWGRRGETRLRFGVISAVLAGAGLALWIDPAAFSLPPLGGRFAGSWTLMLATLAAWAAVGYDARLPTLALVALPAGALVGALRTEADPALLAALIALIAVSAAPDAAARTARAVRTQAPRSRRARPTPRPTAWTR